MIDPPPDNWEAYWKYFYEILNPAPPVGAWGVVKGCEAVAQLLREQGCKRLLEAASGIGLKAITFRRLGFEVVGMDACALAVELSRQLSKQVGIDVPFHVRRWEEVEPAWAEPFDAVFIDQALNVRTEAELTAAASCAAHALRPGGIFLFGAMSAEEWDMTAEQRLSRRWPAKPQPRIAWTKDHADRQTTTISVPQPYPHGIYHSFFHLTQAGTHRSLEHSGFLENLAWQWDQLVQILKNAGFSQIFRRPPENGTVSAIAVR